MSLLAKAACAVALATLGLGSSELQSTCGIASGDLATKSASLMQSNQHSVKRTAAVNLEAKRKQPSIAYGSDSNTCPSGYERIVDEAECRASMPLIQGGDPDHYNGNSGPEADYPSGCYSCNRQANGCSNGVWFNPHASGAAATGARPVCKQDFSIQTGATLFVGDSDIDYWHTSGTAIPGSYNVGIGGNTCRDVLKEIDFLMQNFQPSSVVLICGENDLASGTPVGKTFGRWKQVVEKILAQGARVTMLGTKPEADSVNLHTKYQAYDTKIKEYVVKAASEGAPAPVVFVDSFKAFTAMGNADSLYDPSEAPNYLHLGPNGYAHFDRWAQLATTGLFGCMIWEGDACVAQAPLFVAVAAPANACPTGYRKLETVEECRAVAGLVRGSLDSPTWQGSEDEAGWPAGCYYCGPSTAGCTTGTWFNGHATGAAKPGARLYCKLLD